MSIISDNIIESVGGPGVLMPIHHHKGRVLSFLLVWLPRDFYR